MMLLWKRSRAWWGWYFHEYSYRLGKYVVQEASKAEGVVLDLIHFLAQIIVEETQSKQTKTHKNHQIKTNQTIKHNNKHTCE